jgi:hypothetical protein
MRSPRRASCCGHHALCRFLHRYRARAERAATASGYINSGSSSAINSHSSGDGPNNGYSEAEVQAKGKAYVEYDR